MKDHASSPRTGSGRRLARLAVIAAGLVALGWFISRVDWSETWQLLTRLGWFAPLLLLPYFVVYGTDTMGWLFCFSHRPALRFGRLFRIRWAGEAVNSVLPSGYIGGEAVKVFLLRRHGVPALDGVTAGVLSKTQQSVAQLIFLMVASAVFLSLGTATPGFGRGLFVVLGAGTVILGAWLALQRRGVFASAADLLRWLGAGGGRLENRLRDLRPTDARIAGFRRDHPRHYVLSLGAYLSGWLLDTVEILLFSHLLGEPISWKQAIAVEAFTGVAKALSVVIPGAIGVQESSIVFLCRMAGVGEPLGVAYAIVRRVRELIFAAIGWKFLFLEEVRVRDMAAPATVEDPGRLSRE